MDGHVQTLRSMAAGRSIWVPTFNYGYCRTGVYHVQGDASEVGSLSEYVRVNYAAWRSRCPVFNFAGSGPEPGWNFKDGLEVDPFGSDSMFGDLVKLSGTLVWYGAPISSATIVHHALRVARRAIYRYDKVFEGRILDESHQPQVISLRYHVRPHGRALRYDWSRIAADVRNAGILRELSNEHGVVWAPASELVSFWVECLHNDALYFLNSEAVEWVSEALNRLGRPFELDDFEGRGPVSDHGQQLS